MWEVAAMLGLHRPADERHARTRKGSSPGAPPRSRNAERVAHAKGLGPKPEPAAPDPSEIAGLVADL